MIIFMNEKNSRKCAIQFKKIINTLLWLVAALASVCTTRGGRRPGETRKDGKTQRKKRGTSKRRRKAGTRERIGGETSSDVCTDGQSLLSLQSTYQSYL